MCGIFAYHSNNDMHLIVEDLKEELVKLHHRGPDNTGSWANNEVFMGHTRLSILDISAFGNQPYCFEELVLAFNGEIFNFLELRDDLIKLGYDFVSGSDTEVVIKAFHAFGVECFERFNGMWSLIIYDQTSGKLVISRDRFGQKPLFYSHDNEKLIVASEIQAIIPHVDVKPNYSAISSFLKEGDFNANENTFFDGVFEFPCACYAIYEDGSFTEVANYWDYPCEVKEHSGKEDSEFHRLLDDAVGIRLRTDVEYGVLLSGGCDSTIISGITRELIEARERIKSYTFASDDHDDESEFAQEIASALNFENTIVKSSITQNEFRTKLQLIVRHLGRGHSSPAILSIDSLFETIKSDRVKVVLDGQGADELLAGYRHYHIHLIFDLLLNFRIKDAFVVLTDAIGEGLIGVLTMALRNSLNAAGKKLMRIFFGYEACFEASFREKLSSGSVSLEKVQPQEQKSGIFHNYLMRQHKIGLRNLLYYGDILAMKSSIENRSPFMDHRLVDLAFSVSSQLHVSGAKDKSVLRKHPIYSRFKKQLERKKIGFNSPINASIRLAMAEELSSSEILKWPIFARHRLMRLLVDGPITSQKFERFLFRLYQVHLWNLEFLKR